MAIKFLSDVLGSGELEGVTIEATDNITIGGSSDNALTISSGDVVVGGSSGTSGQVLTSNGSGNGTSWTAKTTNSNDFLTGLSFNTGNYYYYNYFCYRCNRYFCYSYTKYIC